MGPYKLWPSVMIIKSFMNIIYGIAPLIQVLPCLCANSSVTAEKKLFLKDQRPTTLDWIIHFIKTCCEFWKRSHLSLQLCGDTGNVLIASSISCVLSRWHSTTSFKIHLKFMDVVAESVQGNVLFFSRYLSHTKTELVRQFCVLYFWGIPQSLLVILLN